MPPGLRPSLYVRDDDYRYSFLFGNFITLTNLSEADWERIGAQHLTPLYISIHATDLFLRRELLGNPQAPDIVQQLQRLGEMGIRVHGQIVIVPGMNDGQALRTSIEELFSLYPTVQTLALVPVGLTRFQTAPLRTLYPREATAVLDMAEEYIAQAQERVGRTWLYPSDELYLLADRPLPLATFYDDDAQLENGAGLVRAFVDEWKKVRAEVPDGGNGSSITLVYGTLIAPLMRRLADELVARWGGRVHVVPVANQFFGRSVTVSGLLMGGDVLAALEGIELGQRVFLPRAMFGSEGRRTLDDLTREDIEGALGVPVILASRLGDVVEALV
jgi:putative radical SAM enzyme (TIGR03279 family)